MSPFRVAVMFTVVVSFLCPPASRSAEDSAVLFRNVRIFNGVDAELAVGDVLIDVVRIPHAGWPERHSDVENLAFRVTLEDAITVLHLGDADTNPDHYKRHPDHWEKRTTQLALPPFWFFLSEGGRYVLDEIIRPDQSIGIHVSNDIPEVRTERPEGLQDVDLFTSPGETRQIQ